MAKVIDTKILKFAIDSGQFNSELRKISSSVSDINKTINSQSFDGFKRSLQGIQSVFSATGTFGRRMIENLADAAFTQAIRIKDSLTNSIRSGFEEYQLNIDSTAIILNNVKASGKGLTEVTNALDTLNTYADKTIFNFSQMTSNLGKFTNAGVGLDDAVNIVKGLGNLAGSAGATAEDLSRGTYQLSQAFNNGYLMLMDWNSMVNANLATQQFRMDVVKESIVKGTLKLSAYGVTRTKDLERDALAFMPKFRDSLKDAWLKTDIIKDVLTKYAANPEMEKMASQIRTFSKLMDTVFEAKQSGWGRTFRLLTGDYEQSTWLWSKIGEAWTNSINESADKRNKFFLELRQLGGTDDFIRGIINSVYTLKSAIEQIKEGFGLFSKKVENAVPLVNKVTDVAIKFKKATKDAMDYMQQQKPILDVFTKIRDSIPEITRQFVELRTKAVYSFNKALQYTTTLLKNVQNQFINFIHTINNNALIVDILDRIANSLGISDDLMSKITTNSGKLSVLMLKFSDELAILAEAMSNISNAFYLLYTGIVSRLAVYIAGIDKNIVVMMTNTEKWKAIIGAIAQGLTKIIDALTSLFSNQHETKSYLLLNIIRAIVKGFMDFSKWVQRVALDFALFNKQNTIFSIIFNTIKNILSQVKTTVIDVAKSISVNIPNAFNRIKNALSNVPKTDFVNLLTKIQTIAVNRIKKVGDAFVYLFDGIGKGFKSIDPVKIAILVSAFSALILALKFNGNGAQDDYGSGILGPINIIRKGVNILDDALAAFSKLPIVVFTLGIASIMKSIIKLGTMTNSSYIKGVGAFVVVVGALAASMIYLSKSFSELDDKGMLAKAKVLIAITSVLIGISFSVVALSSSVKRLSTLDLVALGKGLTTTIVALGSVMLILSKTNVNNSQSIKGLSVMLASLAISITIISKIKAQDLLLSISAMLSIIGSIVLISKIAGDVSLININSLGTAVMGIAAAMAILSFIKPSRLAKGLAGVAIILTEIIGFNKLIGDTNIKTYANMGNVIKAITGMISAIAILSFMKVSTITKGIITIAFLLAEITALSKTMGTTEHSFAGLAGVVFSLTVSIGLLSQLKIGSLTKGILALGAAMSLFATVTKALSGGTTTSMSILAVAGSIGILAASIALIGKLPIPNIVVGLVALGTSLAGLVFAMGALAPVATAALPVTGTIAAIGASALAAAGAIYILTAAVEKIVNLFGKKTPKKESVLTFGNTNQNGNKDAAAKTIREYNSGMKSEQKDTANIAKDTSLIVAKQLSTGTTKAKEIGGSIVTNLASGMNLKNSVINTSSAALKDKITGIFTPDSSGSLIERFLVPDSVMGTIKDREDGILESQRSFSDNLSDVFGEHTNGLGWDAGINMADDFNAGLLNEETLQQFGISGAELGGAFVDGTEQTNSYKYGRDLVLQYVDGINSIFNTSNPRMVSNEVVANLLNALELTEENKQDLIDKGIIISSAFEDGIIESYEVPIEISRNQLSDIIGAYHLTPEQTEKLRGYIAELTAIVPEEVAKAEPQKSAEELALEQINLQKDAAKKGHEQFVESIKDPELKKKFEEVGEEYSGSIYTGFSAGMEKDDAIGQLMADTEAFGIASRLKETEDKDKEYAEHRGQVMAEAQKYGYVEGVTETTVPYFSEIDRGIIEPSNEYLEEQSERARLTGTLVGENAVNNTKGFFANMSEIFEDLSKSASKAMNPVANFFDRIGTALVSFLETVKLYTPGWADFLIDGLIGIGELIAKPFKFLNKGVEFVAKGIVDWIADIKKSNDEASAINEANELLVEEAKKNNTSINEENERSLKAFNSSMNSLNNGIVTFNESGELVKLGSKVDETIMKATGLGPSLYYSILTPDGHTWTDLYTGISGDIEDATGKISDDVIDNFRALAGDGIEEFDKKIAEGDASGAIKGVVDKIQNDCNRGVVDFTGAGSALAEKLYLSVSEQISNTDWTRVTKGVEDGITRSVGTGKVGSYGGVQIGDNVERGARKRLEIKSPSGVFTRIGRYIIDGLNKGIDGNVNKAEKTAGALSNAVISRSKKDFGINSPSTVYANIGKNIVVGFAKGINDNITIAREAINKLMYDTGSFNKLGIIEGIFSKYGTGNSKNYDIKSKDENIRRLAELKNSAITAQVYATEAGQLYSQILGMLQDPSKLSDADFRNIDYLNDKMSSSISGLSASVDGLDAADKEIVNRALYDLKFFQSNLSEVITQSKSFVEIIGLHDSSILKSLKTRQDVMAELHAVTSGMYEHLDIALNRIDTGNEALNEATDIRGLRILDWFSQMQNMMSNTEEWTKSDKEYFQMIATLTSQQIADIRSSMEGLGTEQAKMIIRETRYFDGLLSNMVDGFSRVVEIADEFNEKLNDIRENISTNNKELTHDSTKRALLESMLELETDEIRKKVITDEIKRLKNTERSLKQDIKQLDIDIMKLRGASEEEIIQAEIAMLLAEENLESESETLSDTLQTVRKEIETYFSASDFVEMGESIINNLVDGISRQYSGLKNVGIQMAEFLTRGFNETYAFNDPMGVFTNITSQVLDSRHLNRDFTRPAWNPNNVFDVSRYRTSAFDLQADVRQRYGAVNMGGTTININGNGLSNRGLVDTIVSNVNSTIDSRMRSLRNYV